MCVEAEEGEGLCLLFNFVRNPSRVFVLGWYSGNLTADSEGERGERWEEGRVAR